MCPGARVCRQELHLYQALGREKKGDFWPAGGIGVKGGRAIGQMVFQAGLDQLDLCQQGGGGPILPLPMGQGPQARDTARKPQAGCLGCVPKRAEGDAATLSGA